MGKIWIPPSIQSVRTWEDLKRFVSQFTFSVSELLTGKLRLQDNFFCQLVKVGPNQLYTWQTGQTAIPHNLGVVPSGYLVINQTLQGDVVAGSSAWTPGTIYLTTDNVNSVFTILILG